jgi:PmbA protein
LADPLKAVTAALQSRHDLLGWTAVRRHIQSEQLFADRSHVEVRRSVQTDLISVDVLCSSEADQGACGAASVTLNAGDDPRPALEFAVSAARRTRNPLYGLPEPGPLPEVATSDPEIAGHLPQIAPALHDRLMAASAADRQARLTLAEWFADHETIHLANSRGIDAEQSRTRITLEWIVLAGQGEGRVDTTLDLRRGRLADLDVEEEWAQVAQQTADRQRAQPAPSYQGPVVVRGKALETFLHGDTLATLSSGQQRYAQLSHWEPGKSVFRGEVRGDPLTLWATRLLPFGDQAGRFDDEGLPGQRVLVIEDNLFRAYLASQRYATYLGVPPTGSTGDVELPAGATPQADLLAGPHVEIVAWSWFSPEPTTGDFASEIRLGYLVDGADRRPFTGGMLVGNMLDALADVRWSSETGFFGSYQGPTTARFASLQVAPSRD